MKQVEAKTEAQWLEAAGVPRIFRQLEIQADRVPKPVREWADGLPECLGDGGSALLVGGPGTGKTVAAVWFMREVWQRWEGPRREGHYRGSSAGSLYVRAPDIVDALFARRYELIDRMRKVRLLVIDDWGMAFDKSGWGAAAFDDLIDRRWTEELLTIVTSNLPPDGPPGGDSFTKRFPRATSRLLDRRGPGVVLVEGPDMRGMR